MLFEFINYWFPDTVARSYVYDLRSAVTWQMAAVAVAFPIYLIVMRLILRETANQPVVQRASSYGEKANGNGAAQNQGAG